MSDSPPETQDFTEHRELLFAIVYSMLGSVADTEDVLQETWLAWARRHRARDARPIDNPRAYLVRIAVHQALARQAAIRRRRESYVGPWLPEPLVTDDRLDAAESVSMALLVVLETLTPLERAVFVLNEVFGYAHTEIAELLGRAPSAVRQLAHRAREHVHARRPRFRADPRRQHEVTEQFLAALLDGDLPAFLRLLAPEVTIWTDGGGKARASGLRGVQSRDRVARMLVAASSRPHAGLEVRRRRVNGDPSVLLLAEGSLFAVLVLDLTPDGDQVCGVYAVTNPDKLPTVESS